MKRGKDQLAQIREGHEAAAIKRRQLVERLKARQTTAKAPVKPAPAPPEPRRCALLDVDAAISAAMRLRFRRLQPTLEINLGEPEPLNRPTLSLLRGFLTTVATAGSVAVLQWPLGERDVSALHPLAMLAALCSPPEKTCNRNAWCEAVPDFRTLYFPWRGGATAAGQRSLLVDRHEFLKRNSRGRVPGDGVARR